MVNILTLLRMGPEINKGNAVTCPYIAPDESYIIFARMGTGLKDSGIFISFRNNTNKWLPAIMLAGGSIERGGMSPRISPDVNICFMLIVGCGGCRLQK